MKESIIIIGTLTLCAIMAKAGDIRVVNGRAVDLQPIHDWEEAGKPGERPLKHWREIELVAWQAQGPQGHAVATIKVENTEERHVWLKNCPKPLLQDLARIAELEQQESAALERSQQVANWAEAVGRSAAVPGFVVVAADQRYVNWLAAREYEAANATALADATRHAAQKITADLALMRAKLAEKKILAMDTGTLYGSDPVWDTGLVGR